MVNRLMRTTQRESLQVLHALLGVIDTRTVFLGRFYEYMELEPPCTCLFDWEMIDGLKCIIEKYERMFPEIEATLSQAEVDLFYKRFWDFLKKDLEGFRLGLLNFFEHQEVGDNVLIEYLKYVVVNFFYGDILVVLTIFLDADSLLVYDKCDKRVGNQNQHPLQRELEWIECLKIMDESFDESRLEFAEDLARNHEWEEFPTLSDNLISAWERLGNYALAKKNQDRKASTIKSEWMRLMVREVSTINDRVVHFLLNIDPGYTSVQRLFYNRIYPQNKRMKYVFRNVSLISNITEEGLNKILQLFESLLKVYLKILGKEQCYDIVEVPLRMFLNDNLARNYDAVLRAQMKLFDALDLPSTIEYFNIFEEYVDMYLKLLKNTTVLSGPPDSIKLTSFIYKMIEVVKAIGKNRDVMIDVPIFGMLNLRDGSHIFGKDGIWNYNTFAVDNFIREVGDLDNAKPISSVKNEFNQWYSQPHVMDWKITRFKSRTAWMY